MNGYLAIHTMLQMLFHREEEPSIPLLSYKYIKEMGPEHFFEVLLAKVKVEETRVKAIRVPLDFLSFVEEEGQAQSYRGIPLIFDQKLDGVIGIVFEPPSEI